MSHLSSYQQKQFRKKITIYVIALILLIIFLFSVGLKLLINTSFFIGNLTSSKKSTENTEKKESFYGTLSIDDIPVATNSAKIIVSGSFSNFNNLEFYINDKKVKEEDYKNVDTFSEEIGNLNPGQNEVYLKAENKDKKQKKESQKYTVNYKIEKPKLEITEPSTQTTTNLQEIKIAGQTDNEVYIRVNGLPIVVDANGNFQTLYRLKDGSNEIIVRAEDNAGNFEEKTLSISYKKDD